MKVLHVNNIAYVGEMMCKDLKEDGVITKLIDKDAYSKYDPRPYLKLIKELIFGKHDLIHIHYPATPMAAIASLHPKVIVHFHGSDTRLSSYRKKLVKFACRKAKLAFYSTPDLKKNLEWLNIEKVFLPNYVYEQENIHDPNNKKILLFANLSDKAKGIHKYKPMLSKIDNLYTIFRGIDKERYKKRYPNIHYLKEFNREELKDFLSNFGFILGQRTGQIGVSELEAMSFGIPTFFDFEYNEFYPEPLPIAIKNNHKIGEKQRQWVQKYHHKDFIIPKIIESYAKISTKVYEKV